MSTLKCMTTPKRTNLQLDPDVRKRLEAFAERTHRTLTASANMGLTEWLDSVDEALAADATEKERRA